MISFKRVKESRIIQVAGVCNTSAEFASLVNEADRRLLRRGDFARTTVPIFVCVYNGCVVWPRYVGAVRKINICNQAIPVHNGWYHFLPANLPTSAWASYCGQETHVIQKGVSPVLQDVQGDGRYIRAYIRCLADAGKTMTFLGIDNNGQPLMTDNGDGTWSEGITLTLVSPFVSTAIPVRRIDYVIREATQCIVDVYAYQTDGTFEDIAHYDPTDTEPQYIRQSLTSGWTGCNTGLVTPNCCGVKQGVYAMVKVRHIDAVVDTDLLAIDNLDALKLEILSIKAEEAGDVKLKRDWEASAVEVLNRDLEDTSPVEEFSASNNVLGPYTWSNQCR